MYNSGPLGPSLAPLQLPVRPFACRVDSVSATEGHCIVAIAATGVPIGISCGQSAAETRWMVRG